jgi:hypothetical protein
MSNAKIPDAVEALRKHVAGGEEGKRSGIAIENSPFLPSALSLEDAPADASFKSIFQNAAGEPKLFLLCSNSLNPDLIARNVAKAREAQALLGDPLGNTIQMPLKEDRFEGLTWALFTLNQPLSNDPWRWRWEKARIAWPVTTWLTSVVRKSKIPIVDQDMTQTAIAPLKAFSENEDFPMDFRQQANRSIKRIESGAWKPQTILAHNDLWKGNIMLPGSDDHGETSPKFRVIDWAGSSTKGFAFFDLMKLARSFKFPGLFTKQIIRKQCALLECAEEDVMSYLLAALGTLGMNLENFPPRIYAQMAMECIDDLHRIINKS